MNRGFYLGVPRLTPFVRALLVTIFIVFVLHLIAENFLDIPLFALCALWIGPLRIDQLWQIFTHLFVQPLQAGSIVSVFFSLLFLWWIISPFEERYGARRTFELCVWSVLGWSLLPIAIGPFLEKPIPLFGTSALAFGGFAAFAVALRRSEVMLFGVLPIKSQHLIGLAVGYSLLLFLASRNVVILLAGLGATGGGALYAWWLTKPPRPRRPKTGDVVVPFMRGDNKKPNHWIN